MDFPKISQTTIPTVITRTNSPPEPQEGTTKKESCNERFKAYVNDNSWAGIIRTWGLAAIFALWGGNGIYEAFFKQKEDTTPQIKLLEDKNKNLEEQIRVLQKEVDKLKRTKE